MKAGSILITRPEHDATTRYISRWNQCVIDEAERRGVDVFDLRKEGATRKEFVSRVSKLRPSLILLNGHGNEDTVTGHDNEPLVSAAENPGVLHGAITYALSCRSAAQLGKVVITESQTAFIGYQEDFIFVHDQTKIGKPLEDEIARPFMESSNHVAISLLKGHTCVEASERSREMFRRNVRQLLSSQTSEESLLAARALWWDTSYQVCLGDGTMRLVV